MSLSRNEQALIELVTGDARARGEEALARARSEAARLLREARAEARRSVHRSCEDARRHARERIAAAQASLETARRLAAQRRHAALLVEGWQALPGALVERWRQDDTRAAWVAHALDDALRALPRHRWRVTHAPGWPADERGAFAARVVAATGELPELSEDATLRAGITIADDGTSIDATLTGLVADRADLGGALLRHIDADASEATP